VNEGISKVTVFYSRAFFIEVSNNFVFIVNEIVSKRNPFITNRSKAARITGLKVKIINSEIR